MLLNRYVEKFNELTQKMRLLVAFLGVVFILVFWYFNSYDDLYSKRSILELSHSEIENQTKSLKNITNEKGRLVYSNNLITSESLANLLESILENNEGLELISLEKKNRINLSSKDREAIQNLHEVLGQSIYATDIEVILQGDFFAFLKYLEKITSESNNGIFWQSLRYDVSNYPKANITMVMRTLSKG